MFLLILGVHQNIIDEHHYELAREGLGPEKGRKKRAGGVILGCGKEGKEEMGRCGKMRKKREMGRRRELG